MEEKKFLDEVLEHIPRLTAGERQSLRRELSDHVADHVEMLERRGLEKETAQEQAVNAMGDPEEVGRELAKLYVDPFFQRQGIGARLLDWAVRACGARTLWALEKNEGALRFYARHGFALTGEWKYEEGTTERLVRLELK